MNPLFIIYSRKTKSKPHPPVRLLINFYYPVEKKEKHSPSKEAKTMSKRTN